MGYPRARPATPATLCRSNFALSPASRREVRGNVYIPFVMNPAAGQKRITHDLF